MEIAAPSHSRTLVRRIRMLMAVLAAVVLAVIIGPAFGAAPQAGAQETYRTVSGGSLNWGFKQSFRSYITTGAAKGKIELSGGVSDGGQGFRIPPTAPNRTTVSGAGQGAVGFDGVIKFFGHQVGQNWILDTTMSNFQMKFNGNRAEIVVDMVAREFKGTTYDDIGDYITSRGITIATVNLNKAVDFNAETIDLSGSTTLTTTGAQAFGGFYEAGIALDPTSGQLTLTDTTTAPGGGSGGSGSGTGVSGTTGQTCGDGSLGAMTTGGEADGILGTLQGINDTFAMWNNIVVNTERLFCNIDVLQARFNPNYTTGPVTVTDATGTTTTTEGTTTGGDTVTIGGDGGATTGGAGAATGSGVTAGAAASAAGGGVATASAASGGTGNALCFADSSVGVTQSTAAWGVKSSFQTYIRGSIAKGSWTLDGVGHNNQEFQFSGGSGAVDPAASSGTIYYPGSMHFVGHGGVLDMKLSNIEIVFSGNSGELIADAVSSNMDGVSSDFGRTVLGTLSFSNLDVNESQASGSAAVSLTQAGSVAFADFYQPGQELDPISFSAVLGGAPNCAPAQGSAASGSAPDGASGGGGMAAVNAGATSPTFDGEGEDGQFQIKSAGAESAGALGLDTPTTIMLILAAFVVAGGSMTKFTAGNPTG